MQRREIEAAREARRRYIEQEERRKRARFEDEALRLLAQEKRRIEREEEAEARRNQREDGIEGIFKLLCFGPSFDAPSPAAPQQSKSVPTSKKTKPQPAVVFVGNQAQKVPTQTCAVPSPPHSPIPDLVPTATSVHLAKIASKLTTLASTVLPSASTLHLTSPTIGFHQSNVAHLTQKEQLEKLLLELDGIDSEGKEEVRKERKRLVLRAEEALEELEQKVKAEWETRHKRDEETRDPEAASTVEPSSAEEKSENSQKPAEKEVVETVAVTSAVEVADTEPEPSKNKTISIPIDFVESKRTTDESVKKTAEEDDESTGQPSASGEVEGYEVPFQESEQGPKIYDMGQREQGQDDDVSSTAETEDLALDEKMSAGVVMVATVESEKEEEELSKGNSGVEAEGKRKDEGEYYFVS
ncbi:hypothetical protein BT69DRAFT_1286343 [Atractiella rhizophila]|nr:hypothetical protein BT69DRAFT_1286343 [Atractiella rhizophila]